MERCCRRQLAFLALAFREFDVNRDQVSLHLPPSAPLSLSPTLSHAPCVKKITSFRFPLPSSLPFLFLPTTAPLPRSPLGFAQVLCKDEVKLALLSLNLPADDPEVSH